MKITRTFLEGQLNVTSIIIMGRKSDEPCSLERIEGNLWTLYVPGIHACGEVLSFNLRLKSGKDICFNGIVTGMEMNRVTVRLSEPRSADFTEFLDLVKLHESYAEYGRRKEKRVVISATRMKSFGLGKLEQKIFMKGINRMFPCIIEDVSIHGICLLVPFSRQLENADNFVIQVSFTESTLLLWLHKVHVHVINTGKRKHAFVSCQILEPVNFFWKQKVVEMLKLEA